MENSLFRNDPGPSTSRKRPSTDEIERQFKKLKSQDSMKKKYSSGGLKLFMRGIMFQLKLLMHFVNHAIDKNYPFRLATEMTAAEKLDDIVIEYKKLENRFLIFLQAKHKDDIDEKIKISDLISTSNNNDFSLLKYFISVCKIKSNEMFQDAEQLFCIVTNIDFEFSVYKDQSDGCTSANTKTNENKKRTNAIQQKNNEFEKWENFFDKQPVSRENEFFYFEDVDFEAYERKFNLESTSNQPKAELFEMIQINLLMGAIETKEIANYASTKEKFVAIIIIYLIRNAKNALRNIEKVDKNGKRVVDDVVGMELKKYNISDNSLFCF